MDKVPNICIFYSTNLWVMDHCYFVICLTCFWTKCSHNMYSVLWRLIYACVMFFSSWFVFLSCWFVGYQMLTTEPNYPKLNNRTNRVRTKPNRNLIRFGLVEFSISELLENPRNRNQKIRTIRSRRPITDYYNSHSV